MTIVNNSNTSLLISSKILSDSQIIRIGESQSYNERNFYTVNIHSDIGSCEIKTEYSKRCIRNFGKLNAKLSNEKDERGMKKVIITSVE